MYRRCLPTAIRLTDEAEVVYQMSEFYMPGYERGLRYDDPAFGEWLLPISEISEKI